MNAGEHFNSGSVNFWTAQLLPKSEGSVLKGKRELVHSDRRMAQLARDVGFKTANRMCEIFRRELGITPTDYRKERQIRRIR